MHQRSDGSVDALIDEEALELGQELQEARKAGHLSIADIANRLKITEQVVEALEAGDLSKLQHKRRVYIEGYYASYARMVGVSLSNTRFDTYDHDKQIPDHKDSAGGLKVLEPKKKHLGDYSDAMITGLVVLLVIVVGGIIWWVWPTVEDEATSVEAPSTVAVVPSETDTESIDSAEESETVPFYLRSDNQSNTEDSDLPSDSGVDLTLESGGVSSPSIDEEAHVLSVEEDFGLNDPQTSLESQSSTELEPSESQSLVPTVGTLEFAFTGLSWVEVTDATGASLLRELGRRGQSTRIEGMLPISLRIGDATNVELRFNEEPVNLEPHTDDRVANLTLP